MTKHATLLGSAADGAATQGVHDARVNVRAATQGVLDRRVDQRPTYSPRLVREAEEQAMISKDIDAAEESRALFDRSVDRRVERLLEESQELQVHSDGLASGPRPATRPANHVPTITTFSERG
jgi:hypothetical protein